MWRILFAGSLVIVSAALYGLDYILFRDAHDILFSLLGNIAFVPIYVLLVTLVIERVFESNQRNQRFHKLNMVLGAFFSEVGNPLLSFFSVFHEKNTALLQALKARTDWKNKDFSAARSSFRASDLSVDIHRCDLLSLKAFLVQKRAFLLALLENPNLLEHDKMTDMLWAIFHLSEELTARQDLKRLSDPDRDHLSIDLRRAYSQLVLEWLEYMRHLNHDYPYLYSLAVRVNPFDPDASAEIK
jgi:hypothetical protein